MYTCPTFFHTEKLPYLYQCLRSSLHQDRAESLAFERPQRAADLAFYRCRSRLGVKQGKFAETGVVPRLCVVRHHMRRCFLLAYVFDEHVIFSRVDDVESVAFVALLNNNIACSARIMLHRGKDSQALASAQMLKQKVCLYCIFDAAQFVVCLRVPLQNTTGGGIQTLSDRVGKRRNAMHSTRTSNFHSKDGLRTEVADSP